MISFKLNWKYRKTLIISCPRQDAKAALEQCRKDALYEAFKLYYTTETDKRPTCSCQHIQPQTTWALETEPIPDGDIFW